MKINLPEFIKFTIAVAVTTAAAVLWFPGVAQDKVDAQHSSGGPATEAHKRIEKKADGNDAALDEVKLEQVAMKGDLKATRDKLAETGKKIDALLEELRKNPPRRRIR